jgi:hypothetical protein
MNLPKFTLVHRGPSAEKAVQQWTSRINEKFPQASLALSAVRPKHTRLHGAVLASLDPMDFTPGTFLADEIKLDFSPETLLKEKIKLDFSPETLLKEKIKRAFSPETLLTEEINLDFSPEALLTKKIVAVNHELQRHANVTTVGIWDLGSRIVRLPALVEKMNAAQPAFLFFEVKAGIPAGLISQPERVVKWWEAVNTQPLSKQERSEVVRNTIAEDFYPRADVVREDLGVDYIVGLTPSMVAFGKRKRYYNYISSSQGRTLLVSTADYRAFAEKAGRPLEVLVGCAVIGQLLVEMFADRKVKPELKLKFHEDTGCLFDFNEDRVSFAEVAKNPHIEKDCMKRIPPAFRASAQSLMDVLASYPNEK